MQKHLHIISLTVPYPVDYGGVFDLFYKLVELKEQGIKIHLHCFDYGRGEQPELNKYCEQVYYYKRQNALKSFSLHTPYIVASRNNTLLFERLAADNYPILMEGIHCTGLLHDRRFITRKCFVRLHNVEHIYYRNLYLNSTSPLKRLYYKWESKLLFSYEKSIADKATFWSVTPADAEMYKSLGCTKVEYVPLFLPEWKVNCNEGKGTFCLYQGDLSVAENEKAALWLLTNVFNDLDIPFVIAGKNPSTTLQAKAEKKSNTCIVANPTHHEMQDMIEKAHLNIIPSYNKTGIKLKLINALYNGRFCVVNASTVAGTHLSEACYIADDADDFRRTILDLFNLPFTTEYVSVRHQLLDKVFDNCANAQHLIQKIWNE